MRRGTAFIGGLVIGLLASGASASAAVTIGSNLAATPNLSPNIAGYQTSVQATLDPAQTAAGGLTAPFDGVVVLFRYKQDFASAIPIYFRVIHPVSGIGTSVGAGTSAPIVPQAGITMLPVRMPISQGDEIGIDCCDSSAHGGFYRDPSPADVGTYIGWTSPILADGGSPRASNNGDTDLELLANADIERDVDHDGFGDETQDGCPAQTATHDACNLATSVAARVGKKGQVAITVGVPGAGTVTAGDAGDKTFATIARKTPLRFRPASVSTAETTPNEVSLTLKLNKAGRAKLREQGKLKARIKVVYAPGRGPSGTQTIKVKFKA